MALARECFKGSWMVEEGLKNALEGIPPPAGIHRTQPLGRSIPSRHLDDLVAIGPAVCSATALLRLAPETGLVMTATCDALSRVSVNSITNHAPHARLGVWCWEHDTSIACVVRTSGSRS